MRELYPDEVRLMQEGGQVRVTGTAGEYCLINQTVEAIATHLQASCDALLAAFRAHAVLNGCGPTEALLRRLSTHMALRFIHRFNAWNNQYTRRAKPFLLDITWPALERWGGTQEIMRFARQYAGTDWQAFAQCVGLLDQEEFANAIQRMKEFENGW